MRRLTIILVLVVLVTTCYYSAPYAREKLGLILAAHGSPVPKWNEQVLQLEDEVTALLNETGRNPFHAIGVGMMEFAEPTLAAVIADMERQGVESVYVIPLFIAPSSHSVFDLPTILGLYSDNKMLQELQREQIKVASTRMRITVGPTLNYGSVQKEIMLERAQELSTKPGSEGIVLLAHGDHLFEPVWESVCRDIGNYVCAHTGIPVFDFAFVEIGQSLLPEGIPAILGVAQRCKRTIVLGLYLSVGVEGMVQGSTLSVGRMTFRAKEMLADHDVVFASCGLLPSKRVSTWISSRAIEWSTWRDKN